MDVTILFSIICFIVVIILIAKLIYIIKLEKIAKSNQNNNSDGNSFMKEDTVNPQVEKEKGRICILDEHGKMISCGETAYLDNYEEEKYVLYHPEDKKHYHVFLSCYKNWEYKEKFDYWRCITIQEAEDKGLTLCKTCSENLQPKEEKLKKILQNKNYKYITLMGCSSKDVQEVLTWLYLEKIYLTKVFFEYEYETNKFLVKDNYGQLLGFVKESTLEKNGIENIENLPAYINKIYSINGKETLCCEIVIVLEEN